MGRFDQGDWWKEGKALDETKNPKVEGLYYSLFEQNQSAIL